MAFIVMYDKSYSIAIGQITELQIPEAAGQVATR